MYRIICTEFWSDPKVRTLSQTAKLLFLYYISNPHSHYSGIYYQPAVTMRHEMGVRTGFEGASKELSNNGLVCFESAFEQVWVVNMYAYQGKGKNMDKGAALHLSTLHNSSLIHKFLAKYPSVLSHWSGTPFEPPSEPLTRPDYPVPVPDLLISSLNSSESEFEQFWNCYPKKVGKKIARAAWEKAADKPTIQTVLTVVMASRTSDQWQRENGKYIPHPTRWINEGRWSDQPITKAPTIMEKFLARHQEEA